MLRVTLDTNSIIDLEQNSPFAPALRELVALHRAGNVRLCVSAIAASERDRDPATGEPSFEHFTAKLSAADLADAEELAPPAYWDIAFWDHFIWAELGDTLEPQISAILFPNGMKPHGRVPNETAEQRRVREAGTNQLCDVLTLWCHIHYGGHVFVTRDKVFHQATKKPRLIALGAGQILEPDHALRFVRSTL